LTSECVNDHKLSYFNLGPGAGGGGSQLKVMEVAKQFVGRIIGKKGENVVTIAKASGCTIRIDQDIEPCRVNITGPASGIPVAEAMIQEVMLNMKVTGGITPTLTQVQNTGAYGQNQAGGYPGQVGGYGMAPPNYYNMQPQPGQAAPNPYQAYGQPAQNTPPGYPAYGQF
jgi:KH domain